MAPPRDLQLDAARGLAVLLVLCGHLLQPVFYGPSGPEPGPALAVWRVIYAFHMPFFFLLCGMVDRIKGEAGLAAAGRSALKLVAVALAFGTLALIPRALDGTLSPADALRDALYGRHFGLGVLWFLVALGLVRVTDAAARAAAFPGGYWVVLGGALALSWICSARAFPFWQVHALVGALPFYVAGRRLGRRAFDVSALLGACGLAVLLLCAPRSDALYGRHFGLGVLWFLVALGLVRVTDAAARAAAFPGGYWVVLGGALALSWICSARAFPFWQVHALVGALPFYVAGRRLGRRAFDVSALLGACGLAVLLLCAPRNFVHVATGRYGDPALFAVTAVAGSAFMLAVVGRLRGPPRAAAALLGRASFELYIVSGLLLLLAPHWPAWDRWDLLALLAALGLPLHLIAARALRGPIRAVRRAADGAVDGLVDGLAGGRRRARAPGSAPKPGFSGADP